MKELESVSEKEKQEEDEKEQDGKKDDGVVKALSGERNNPSIPQKEILNKFSLMVRSLFCTVLSMRSIPYCFADD